MKPIAELSDLEIKAELNGFGFDTGPVNATTRRIYEKKLDGFRKGGSVSNTTTKKPTVRKASPTKVSPPKPVSPKSARKTTTPSSRAAVQQASEAEGSDDELDLSLPPDTPPGSTHMTTRHGGKRNEPEPKKTSSVPISVTRPISKRTPTPPRPGQATSKRAPVRDSPLDTSYRKTFREEEPPRLADSFEDDYDDSMESSRILDRRFAPFRSARKPSPVTKLRDIGRRSWGFFSRTLASPDSSDMNYKTTPPSLYENHASRYGRQANFDSGFLSNSRIEPPTRGGRDFSFWIMVAIGSFTAILAIAYLCTAHAETVEKTHRAVSGALRETFSFLYTYAVLPTITAAVVGAVILAAFFVHKRHKAIKVEENRQLMELVDKITDIIRDAGTEGLAEPHVRDMLLPPTKRTQEEWKRWSEASEFINSMDSRVRTEIRQINGVECNVWIWVPMKKHGWQGAAVAEGSPLVNVPSKALTHCLKLRGVIDGNSRLYNENDLRKELKAKLSPIEPRHIGFQPGPQEGVVYMMFDSLSDAKDAFTAFHSNWFNGNLVTVKYVRDERYAERFPEVARRMF